MSELTRESIRIADMDWEDGVITSYVETWFDVDEKFGLNTHSRDDTWVNMYAHYDVSKKSLSVTYIIDSPDNSVEQEYTPEESEIELLISLMQEYCQRQYGCSLERFSKDFEE